MDTAYFGDQVINQRAKVAAVPGDYDGGCLLGTPGCIDTCTQQPWPSKSSNINNYSAILANRHQVRATQVNSPRLLAHQLATLALLHSFASCSWVHGIVAACQTYDWF